MIRTLILVFFFVSLSANARAQESSSPVQTKVPRFSAGIDFLYTASSLEYLRFSSHFFWNEIDSTYKVYNASQLDSLNNAQNVRSIVSNLRLSFVIHLVHTPRLIIDGEFSLGLSQFIFKLNSTTSDTLKLKMTSTISCPSWGINFNGEYYFGPHWGIALQPSLYYSAGTTGMIQDNEMLQLPGFSESRQNTINYLYSRINLAATYRTKGFKILAGPAFSYCYFANDYVVGGNNPATGDNFRREIHSQFRSGSYFDGFIGMEWTIIPLITVHLYGGFATDLYFQPGVRFNF